MSVEAGLGGGRTLLQYRGGYRERERQREKEQRRLKQRAEVYPPVEFKVPKYIQGWSLDVGLLKEDGEGGGFGSECTCMELMRSSSGVQAGNLGSAVPSKLCELRWGMPQVKVGRVAYVSVCLCRRVRKRPASCCGPRASQSVSSAAAAGKTMT